MTTFREFLSTGRLGRLIPGESTPEAVRDTLGEPLDASVKKNPATWKYGSLELTLYRQPHAVDPLLTAIHLFFDKPNLSIPEGLLAGQPSDLKLCFSRFRTFLDESGIAVRNVRADDSSTSQTTLVLASGVIVNFIDDRLQSIHYTARDEPKGRQLTLFVPDDVLDQARKAAADHGLSIASVCTRWLSEHVEELRKMPVD